MDIRLEMYLAAMDLDTIVQNNLSSTQDHVKAMIFLHHHLHKDLKIEYLTLKDPFFYEKI